MVATSDDEDESPCPSNQQKQQQSSASEENRSKQRERKMVKIQEEDDEQQEEADKKKKRKPKSKEMEESKSAGGEEVHPYEDAKLIGDAVRISGRGRGRRKHYVSFEFDGNQYVIDPVLLVPEDKHQKPYVAIIKSSKSFVRPDPAVPAIVALEKASHEALFSNSMKYNQKLRALVFNLKVTEYACT